MKTTLASITSTLVLTLGMNVLAQDTKKPDAPAASKESPAKTTPAKPKLTPEELEAKFKTTLTKATFTGRWCTVKDGQLGLEKEDKYTIVSVNKVGNDMWVIHARIQYGKKDITAPIPVQ